MNDGQTFEQWIAATSVQRESLFAYAKTEMPTDPALVGPDLDKSLRAEMASGQELVDCEYFLSRIYEVLTDLDSWATLCGLVALVGLYCYLGAA